MRVTGPRRQREDQPEQPQVIPQCDVGRAHTKHHGCEQQRERREAEPQRAPPWQRQDRQLCGHDERGQAIARAQGAAKLVIQAPLHCRERHCLQPQEQCGDVRRRHPCGIPGQLQQCDGQPDPQRQHAGEFNTLQTNRIDQDPRQRQHGDDLCQHPQASPQQR